MASLWQDFMSSPDYLMESPLFPNPFICIRDLVTGGSREVYGRLPWGGMGLWVNQSMRWIVKSHYDDPTLYVLPFIIAILLTLLRLLLNWLIFKRVPKWFKFSAESAEKFPESIWKCCFYMCTWLWCVYIMVSGNHNYFLNLRSLWDGWSPNLAIDPLVHWLYMVEMGFYLHCCYATVYIETIRRDFIIMMAHHVVTLGLLLFSYIVRFHLVGLLILTLLDIGDVFLELSKSVFYFKDRGGKKINRGAEILANMCFAVFALQHIMFRIYWYLTKVLYATMYISVIIFPDGPYYLFFNPLLWILYAMQIYWFKLLLQLLWKILVIGEELGDPRDFEEGDEGSMAATQNGKKKVN